MQIRARRDCGEIRKNREMSAGYPQNSVQPKRVAVLVDTSTAWGRGIIGGIHEYARRHGNWQLFVEARGMDDASPLPSDWHGDGIIARIATPEVAAQLRERKIPVVNVSGIRLPGRAFPTVCNDGEAAARMAVDYFLGRGFRHFAYLSLRGLEYVARQCDAFQAAVGEAGHDCSVRGVEAQAGFIAPDWNLSEAALADWLAGLPRPVAVMAWGGGREVVRACLRAGLRVPQDVAVLSSSDDPLLNAISPVPISGVRNACETIGREAAALLERAMRGEDVGCASLQIEPMGVVTRQSTDTLAIMDGVVAAAVAFMHANLRGEIRMSDLARMAGVSRRSLELRFNEHLGTSPAAFLLRARLDRVRVLLAETAMSVAEIAAESGFGAPEYMTAMFRREFGTTPLRYRKDARVG
jgi:LacI family transcriptional regulator